jgi:hypothetical protein
MTAASLVVATAASQAGAQIKPFDDRYSGPPADLDTIAKGFSSNPGFTAIEFSGTVSHPYNPKAAPAEFMTTVMKDGATETHIKLQDQDYWERTPKVGLLGYCTTSFDVYVRHAVPNSLRCSSPVSWILPLSTLSSKDNVGKVKTAVLSDPTSKLTSTISLWIGAQTESKIPNDPVRRYTLRLLTIDNQSMLAVKLNYELAPTISTSPPTPIEIRYSDYREISGYNVPFRIERLQGGLSEAVFQVQNVTVR